MTGTADSIFGAINLFATKADQTHLDDRMDTGLELGERGRREASQHRHFRTI